MKTRQACLAAFAVVLLAAGAVQAQPIDPLGDLINEVAAKVEPFLARFDLVATLYHGGRGMRDRDSLGCKVVPMRTAAVDGVTVQRHSLLFIKETVGLKMPDGRLHDGYWYASDLGGGIHDGRIDLFTGHDAGSMHALMPLNLSKLSVAKVGEFSGCPSA